MCALCQVAMHGSAAPLAPSLFTIPLVEREFLATVHENRPSSNTAVSYHWHSRGPPTG
jgi:hypothetical protein